MKKENAGSGGGDQVQPRMQAPPTFSAETVKTSGVEPSTSQRKANSMSDAMEAVVAYVGFFGVYMPAVVGYVSGAFDGMAAAAVDKVVAMFAGVPEDAPAFMKYGEADDY